MVCIEKVYKTMPFGAHWTTGQEVKNKVFYIYSNMPFILFGHMFLPIHYITNDHKITPTYYDLKQQIEAFIREGKLQKFVSKERTNTNLREQAPRRYNKHLRPPIGDIRMIVGGTATTGSSKKARKTYLRMVQNIQLTGSVPKIAHRESPIIGFLEEDARSLHHPHDDTLVVSIRVGNYNVHRVLVDNSSSVDILSYPAFQQMGIDRVRLISTNAPLVGFGGTRVFPLGAVTLSMTTGDYP